MGCLDYLRSWRYYLIRTFALPCPCLPASVPIIGGRTLPEILVTLFTTLLFIGLAFSLEATSVGVLTSAIEFLLVFGVSRSNLILNYIFNIHFDYLLYFHKIFGCICVVTMFIHGIKEGISTTGVVLGLCFGLNVVIYFLINRYLKYDFIHRW